MGGRHRNHCPLCLYSKHVDRSHPGDRRSDCRSLMEPIGTFHRPNGEQMVVHRCGGCGAERHNRIAADDNAVALLRLQPVRPGAASTPTVRKRMTLWRREVTGSYVGKTPRLKPGSSTDEVPPALIYDGRTRPAIRLASERLRTLEPQGTPLRVFRTMGTPMRATLQAR